MIYALESETESSTSQVMNVDVTQPASHDIPVLLSSVTTVNESDTPVTVAVQVVQHESHDLVEVEDLSDHREVNQVTLCRLVSSSSSFISRYFRYLYIMSVSYTAS